MRIGHISIYVRDLERSRDFYCHYFKGKSSAVYINPVKKFSSYFIEFESGCRLELMHHPGRTYLNQKENLGIHHLAFSTGSRENVDALTEQIRIKGYTIYGETRVTGDGCYESVILDPDGNIVEITE